MKWLLETYLACAVTVLVILALQAEPLLPGVLKVAGGTLYALALASWLAFAGEAA
jgi:hypothetical protein